MQELIERLQSRAGLSPEQAQKAANVFAEFLETHASSEQLQDLAGRIPGLGAHADKIPDDAAERLGGLARGLFNKRD